jgi:glycosyltransferase involved in cell wall biosynthesis
MHSDSAGLRVALLAGSLTQGGAEKQFVYMARALKSRGVDVRVFSLTSGEHYAGVLAAAGLPPTWIGRQANPLVRSLVLASAVRVFRPHVLQAGHFFANLHVAIAARIVGALAIGSLRNDAFFDVRENGRWGRWLLRVPPALVANSTAAAGNVARLGVSPSRVHVVENVLDLDEFDRASKAGEPLDPEGGMCAAIVCRLVRAKRIDRFLEAIARTRAGGCRVRGLVIGDGPERTGLEARAHALGLSPDAVRFLGRRDDVPALLRRVDVLVVTSDHEGTPNVILEAMAGRLPVVTTPAGDAGRIVRDGQTGFVVPFDGQALDDRLARLAASPELRRQLGEAGREEIVSRYSLQGLGDALLSVYGRIAAETRHARLAQALA